MCVFPVCHMTEAWNCISVALHVKFLLFKSHVCRISVPKVSDSTWGNSQHVQKLLTLSALRCHGKRRTSVSCLRTGYVHSGKQKLPVSKRVIWWPQYQGFLTLTFYSLWIQYFVKRSSFTADLASGLQVKHKYVAHFSLCFWNSILECYYWPKSYCFLCGMVSSGEITNQFDVQIHSFFTDSFTSEDIFL